MITQSNKETKRSILAVTGALLCTTLCLGIAVAPAARAAPVAVPVGVTAAAGSY